VRRAADACRINNACEAARRQSSRPQPAQSAAGFMRLLLAFIAASCVFAQVATSRLEGLVFDPSGRSVAGATVLATNSLTGLRVSTTSDGQGAFVLPSVPASTYTITVQADGFRTTLLSDVVLNGAATTRQSIHLEIGPLADTITVQFSQTAVETSEAQGGHSVSFREIEVLPQLERYPITLALFQPGVQVVGGNVMSSRVNGTRRGSNAIKLDGVDATDPWAPNLLWSLFATTDSTQEFRIITYGAKAEYGRTAGAQIEMITRAGTNRWSGTLSNHLRNAALNANDFFSNSTQPATPRTKFIQNIFGAFAGGPLVPNRTFLFASYEGRRLRQEFVRDRVVLTPSARSGVFRWIPPGSSAVHSFDIVRNDPRGLGIDPRMAELIRSLPEPNNVAAGDGLNTAGFRFNNAGKLNLDQVTARADHNFKQSMRLFFRLTWSRGAGSDGVTNNEAPFPGQPYGTLEPRNLSYAVASDWTISPRTFNETRFGLQRQRTDRTTARLPEPMFVTTLWTPPLSPNFGQDNATSIYELTNNSILLRGSHVVKTGGDCYFPAVRITSAAGMYPDVLFDRSSGNLPAGAIGPPTSVISTPDRQRFEELYNHLLGRISQVRQSFYGDLTSFQPAGTPRRRNFRALEYASFVQDDWRLKPSLTLNAGVRYEYHSPPWERDGLQGTVDKAALINRTSRIADLTMQRSRRWYSGDHNNFAPRFGIAWAPGGDHRTAIRGHYGIFYERPVGSTVTVADNFSPGFAAVPTVRPNQAPGSDVRIRDEIPLPVQPPAPALQSPRDRRENLGLFDPNLRTGYVQQYGLSIQREFLLNTVLEIGIVGNRGVKLLLPINMNQLRIHDDFLSAFRDIREARTHGSAATPKNTLVRLFGSADEAVRQIGGQLFDERSAGAAADRLDTAFSHLYPRAGLSDFYLRNFPQYALVVVQTNEGRSYYDSLQMSLRRQSGPLRAAANYTWSKTIDVASTNGLFAERPLDASNVRLNRARADFDRPHVLSGLLTYTVPIGRSELPGSVCARLFNSVLTGWGVGMLAIWESGAPFSVLSGRRAFAADFESYADYTGDRNIGRVQRRDGGIFWFSAEEMARFSAPEAGEIGSSGRNAFRGPRWLNVDVSLAKKFRISERQAIVFRTEAYNLLNRPNFANPAANLTNPATFGKISATARTNGVPIGGDSGGPRIVQIALRYEF
jgi:hypothetical protein